MIIYIVKTIVCSAVLLGFYYLVLEKERIHSFKRYYLLFSILFSLFVSSITITRVVPEFPLLPSVTRETIDLHLLTVYQPDYVEQSTISFANYLLIIYALITLVLLGRFIRNLYCIYARTRGARIVNYKGAKLVLSSENPVPHSFLSYIIVSEKDFVDGTIEEEIMRHELAHVKQRHSFDILMVEIIILFAWINPLIYIYKRAIQLNHEFMADDYVTRTADDVHSYQMLLLGKISSPIRISYTSLFNYTNIKKRIVMMNRRNFNRFAILRKVALIPVFAALTLLFASKTVTQVPTTATTLEQSTQRVDSGNLIRQYYAILDKCKYTLPNGREGYRLFKVSEDDNARLKALFLQMSEEQQDSLFIVFVPLNSIILTKTTPTKEQFDAFSDSKVYGVWLDGKRISNDELRKYEHADFSFFNVSRLLPNAFNYGKHEFQVNLMTNREYQEHVERTSERSGYRLMPRQNRR